MRCTQGIGSRHTTADCTTGAGEEKVQSRRRIINKPTLWTWQYVWKFSLISFREHKRYKEDDKLERRKCSFFLYLFGCFNDCNQIAPHMHQVDGCSSLFLIR